MFLYLQQELMKISMTIVQFLCTADWPLCLLGRNSSPDWGGDAVQVRGNHSICVYGKPEHQQQDTKHLIAVFRHELMLDVTDCAHDPSGENLPIKKQFHKTEKKSLHSSFQHNVNVASAAWTCMPDVSMSLLLCIQFDTACQKWKAVRYWFEQVCVSVCSVCMHTHAKFCWIHAHIEFISPPERFPVQKESKPLSLETLIFVCFIFLNEM